MTGTTDRLGAGEVFGPVTRQSLGEDLRRLGVRPHGVLLVHASLRSVGWVCGGTVSVVLALRDVLGDEGTLVVPTFTADNRDPSRWQEAPVPESWWPTIREQLPAFDARISPGQRMGALSEQVRTWPGARRSGHPQTSFAALGPAADSIVDGHAVTCHLGEQSPLRRLEELGAQVLLLGVGWNRCTAFHLAEYRRPDPPTRRYSCVVGASSGEWLEFDDVSLSDADFAELGQEFEADSATRGYPGVSRGNVGGASSRLFSLAAGVRFAGEWMERRRGVDAG